MNVSPMLACGPDGSIFIFIIGLLGAAVACVLSFVSGLVCLYKKKKVLGLWLTVVPLVLVGGFFLALV